MPAHPSSAAAQPHDLTRLSSEISPRRLQVFWAVAHAASMTKAAKMLGISQPSLSQQLASLETAIGSRLFERHATAMELTERGRLLLPKVEQVLRSLQELEDGLSPDGPHQTLRIAGATSAMRRILPPVMGELQREGLNVDLDLHEGSPAEVLDLLFARRVNLGLVAVNSLPETSIGFQQVTILEDPYVLVVPRGLDLAGMTDAGANPLLTSTVQFVFGTQHSVRLQEWYDRVLPGNRLTAKVRSFELAIEMVRHGLGVCVAPALSVVEAVEDVRLYATGLAPRRIAAVFPAQYRHQALHARVIALLQEAGTRVALPEVAPMPPFVRRAMEA